MKKQNIFVKVSGDLFNSPDFLKELKVIELHSLYLAICVGGGTQINAALVQAGFELGEHGPLGRGLRTTEERRIAKGVLYKNCTELKNLLDTASVTAELLVPIFESGPVMCHVNGDQYVRTMYNGFDRLYIFTTNDRVAKKVREFENLPKVRIVGL